MQSTHPTISGLNYVQNLFWQSGNDSRWLLNKKLKIDVNGTRDLFLNRGSGWSVFPNFLYNFGGHYFVLIDKQF